MSLFFVTLLAVGCKGVDIGCNLLSPETLASGMEYHVMPELYKIDKAASYLHVMLVACQAFVICKSRFCKCERILSHTIEISLALVDLFCKPVVVPPSQSTCM